MVVCVETMGPACRVEGEEGESIYTVSLGTPGIGSNDSGFLLLCNKPSLRVMTEDNHHFILGFNWVIALLHVRLMECSHLGGRQGWDV